MHDGELAGGENLGGLCLQAIPCNSKGEVQQVSTEVNRKQEDMELEAQEYSNLFKSDKIGLG